MMKKSEPENKAPHADVESEVKSICRCRNTTYLLWQQRFVLRSEPHAGVHELDSVP